ncbi:MAG TPA: META domain-containing protein [Chitinophagaceae bacterium]|nr:META domain-containing protein [Chitinophagaceae bacterium]
MRFLFFIFSFLFLLCVDSAAQKKNKKDKLAAGRPKITTIYGDSVRTDSVVIYETEIGYVMPDHSAKFSGKWNIQVMRRQARAVPDSLNNSYFEFYGDTLFSAFVGCNKINGTFIIKGPTIKFIVTDTALSTCPDDLEQWFIKLIQERVSYFGVDETTLFLKDVAYNIVFDCVRKEE